MSTNRVSVRPTESNSDHGFSKHSSKVRKSKRNSGRDIGCPNSRHKTQTSLHYPSISRRLSPLDIHTTISRPEGGCSADDAPDILSTVRLNSQAGDSAWLQSEAAHFRRRGPVTSISLTASRAYSTSVFNSTSVLMLPRARTRDTEHRPDPRVRAF
jgi:hypothetical protein